MYDWIRILILLSRLTGTQLLPLTRQLDHLAKVQGLGFSLSALVRLTLSLVSRKVKMSACVTCQMGEVTLVLGNGPGAGNGLSFHFVTGRKRNKTRILNSERKVDVREIISRRRARVCLIDINFRDDFNGM